MARISQPGVALKRVALCIGLAFGAMWIGMIAQRLQSCISRESCEITIAIAIVQTVSERG
jgi:NO-binding membrane sensor protein with MHYT domain